MKRYIKSSTTQDRFSRRIIKNIAEEVIREHGENNSIGTYDSFIRTMMDRWGRPDGHDRDFIHDVITKAFEEEFSVKSSTSINCSEEYYELSPELSDIIENYVGHKFKNPTTGWTGSCDAYLHELSDGAILVSLVFGENESEPDEFTYNPETGKSVFYPYHGEIVHANSLDELRNAMRKEYSYLKRVD